MPAAGARRASEGDDRYRATLDHLFSLRRFGMRPGLEVVQALLSALDHPERSFTAIHVAGSKGKGSVAAMAAALLGERGEPIGLFTSPHLRSYRERIQVDRRPIPRAAVVAGIERIRSVVDTLLRDGRLEHPPTFFEITTVLAFDWFRARGVQHAVIEVGLGGRLDATNVLQAPVGVVTTIELEHTEILGDTLAAIAREKAGILHPGMRAIVGNLPVEAAREVERTASERGVPLLHLDRGLAVEDRSLDPRGQTITVVTPHARYEDLRLPLLGAFQPGNAALAVAAVEEYARATGRSFAPAMARERLRTVRWRGRLERVGGDPELFLDVAHTPESARAVAQSLAEIYPLLEPTENVVLFGCLADKRVDAILDALAPLATTLVVVPLASDRTARPEDLRRAGQVHFAKVVQAPDAALGLTLARAATGAEGFTLALGSDYLVGELLAALEGPGEEGPDLADPTSVPAAQAARRRTT